MRKLLLHRLPRGIAMGIAAELNELSDCELRERATYSHSAATAPAVGGSVAPEGVYRDFQRGLEDIQQSCVEEQDRNMAARRLFDCRAGAFLLRSLDIRLRVAIDPDVWSFLSCIVVPHIVRWRYPGNAPERYVGGVRNTLQRLWIRAAVLIDRDAPSPYRVLEALPEDALVQIFERPAIWNDWDQARLIAEALVDIRDTARAQYNFQALVRATILEIRQLMPLCNLSVLPLTMQRQVIASVIERHLPEALRGTVVEQEMRPSANDEVAIQPGRVADSGTENADSYRGWAVGVEPEPGRKEIVEEPPESGQGAPSLREQAFEEMLVLAARRVPEIEAMARRCGLFSSIVSSALLRLQGSDMLTPSERIALKRLFERLGARGHGPAAWIRSRKSDVD